MRRGGEGKEEATNVGLVLGVEKVSDDAKEGSDPHEGGKASSETTQVHNDLGSGSWGRDAVGSVSGQVGSSFGRRQALFVFNVRSCRFSSFHIVFPLVFLLELFFFFFLSSFVEEREEGRGRQKGGE